MKKYLLSLFLLIYPLLSSATMQPLPVNEVFSLTASYTASQLQLQLSILPGHYIYKNKIQISLLSPANTKLPPLTFPPGIIKQHSLLGTFEAYQQPIHLSIPLAQTNATIAFHYQGCAESGFCYPPQTRYISLAKEQISIVNPEDTLQANEPDHIAQLLHGQHYAWILLAFLGFGLLLAFTPCVFPMLPILSGIIIGQAQRLTLLRAFQLSLSYVLAMASTYAMAGIAAAYAGTYLQGLFQKPWLIALFSSIFVLLAFSLFGCYELQLPAAWQQKLTQLSNKQRGGRYIGVILMGCLSALIVSPCVSAPLIGALGYISQTGDLILGGLALFSLGLGMGIPLLIVGSSAGKLLPKAGAWMETIKQIFGVMLLGLAIWLLSRIIWADLSLLLWAGLCLGAGIYWCALYVKQHSQQRRFHQLLGLILLVLGLLLGTELLLKRLGPHLSLSHHFFSPSSESIDFQMIHDQAELNAALQQAQANQQPVIIDFYADWCLSCKAMEKSLLTLPSTQQLLQNFVRLKVDVTHMSPTQKQLMQSLEVVAPPTFVFFKQGHELKSYRLVGEVEVKKFNHTLIAINS